MILTALLLFDLDTSPALRMFQAGPPTDGGGRKLRHRGDERTPNNFGQRMSPSLLTFSCAPMQHGVVFKGLVEVKWSAHTNLNSKGPRRAMSIVLRAVRLARSDLPLRNPRSTYTSRLAVVGIRPARTRRH